MTRDKRQKQKQPRCHRVKSRRQKKNQRNLSKIHMTYILLSIFVIQITPPPSPLLPQMRKPFWFQPTNSLWRFRHYKINHPLIHSKTNDVASPQERHWTVLLQAVSHFLSSYSTHTKKKSYVTTTTTTTTVSITPYAFVVSLCR